MKYFFYFSTFLLFFACKTTQNTSKTSEISKKYRYSVDLTNTKDDELRVHLDVPKLAQSKLSFVVPKIVPGIYGAMDFGQYVFDFQAFDSSGNLLETKKSDVNTWEINNAYSLAKITYSVKDTWDDFKNGANGFYRSAGSSYEADKVFVLNYNTFVGYFEGFEKVPFEVNFTKPKGFYGASVLSPKPVSENVEQVNALNYNDLVDAPLMYSQPDTAWLKVGNTEVLVALYAKNQEKYAKPLATFLEKILTYQKDYLGGKLPVEKYVFLVYHEKNDIKGNYIGDGLEHCQSTICLFNSFKLEDLDGFVGDIAAHEFFHTLTPLNIHSEEIQNYNFRNPTFSKHLWFYEGMTEYQTFHSATKQKAKTIEDLLEVITKKTQEMKSFDASLSLVDMSKNAMQRQDQYYNFYLKGALVNLCLDIELRERSMGKIGTQELMQQLMARYGKDKSFKDDEFFDVITEMTFPEIRTFFKDYVEGTKPLPLKTTMAKVGIEFVPSLQKLALMKNPNAAQLQLRKWWIGE